MEFVHGLSELMQLVGFFGGISLIILAGNKAKIDKMKAERQMWQPPSQTSDTAVLEELKALKRQVGEMQSTGHQFDLSFDAALGRLEERVSRVETKVAAAPAQTEAVQRVGLR